MSKFILGIPWEDIKDLYETSMMKSICEGLDNLIKEDSSYTILPSDNGYLTEIQGGW